MTSCAVRQNKDACVFLAFFINIYLLISDLIFPPSHTATVFLDRHPYQMLSDSINPLKLHSTVHLDPLKPVVYCSRLSNGSQWNSKHELTFILQAAELSILYYKDVQS